MKYLIIIASIFINVAFATETVTLPEVTVTAKDISRGSSIEKLDISTTVITSEEIKSSPELTIDQLLNRQMGVWTSSTVSSQIEPTTPNIGIRGFGNGGGVKTLVMVDGIPINDGFFRTVDWSQVPKDTIDKIEIVRGGGAAALWGNLAEGGVINITTKEPEKGNKSAGFAYGSYNTKIGDAGATLYHSNRLKIGANYDGIESDGYQTAQNVYSSNQVASSSRTHNGLLSIYSTPTDNSKFYVKLSAHELLQDQITLGVANNQQYKFGFRSGGEINLSNVNSLNMTSFFDYNKLDKVNGSLININGVKGLTPDFSNPLSIAQSGMMPSQYEKATYQNYGASVYLTDQHDFNFGSIHDIKYGIDIMGTSLVDESDMQTQRNKTSNANYTSSISSATGKNLFEGVFTQATFTPKSIPLDVTVGLRQDMWQAYDGDIQTSLYKSTGAMSATGQQPAPNQTFTQFNPRLGMKYRITSMFDIRGAIYRNFAAPGMNYQYRTSQTGSQLQMGNTTLAPESNFGQEVGLDFKYRTVKASFTAFHNSLSNYINTVSVCGASYQSKCDMSKYGLAGSSVTQVSQSSNVGDATIKGLEVFLDWQVMDRLNLNASATQTVAVIDNLNAEFSTLNNASIKAGKGALLMTGNQVKNVPQFVLTVGGKLDITKQVSTTWSVKHWNQYFMGTVPNSTYTNEGSTTADIGLNYKPVKYLDLYVNAQNISNATYISKGRNGSAGTANEMGMPRMVFGGFKLDF